MGLRRVSVSLDISMETSIIVLCLNHFLKISLFFFTILYFFIYILNIIKQNILLFLIIKKLMCEIHRQKKLTYDYVYKCKGKWF